MMKMAHKKKYNSDKTSSTGLLDKEEDAISLTSEGASSIDDTNFKDHQFKRPAEKASHKRSRKRKLSELEETCSGSVVLEEQQIDCVIKPLQNVPECLIQDNRNANFGGKARNEKEFQEICGMYSLASDDHSSKRRLHKDTIGIVKYTRRKTYEDIMCVLPPGVGTPPEEIEDIPEELLYWPLNHKNLKSNGDFTREEVAEKIEERITFLLDYFKRLDEGRLTKEERRNGKIPPENFCGPYLPTRKHIRRLKRLDININWPLSELHEICLQDKTILHWNIGDVKKLRTRYPGLQLRLGGMSKKEIEILMKNWIKFQKEYKFYDIRPLIGVKCVRLIESKNKLDCQNYYYVTRDTTNKFLLYMMQGLPDRETTKIYRYLRDVYWRIRGSELASEVERYSLFDKYGVEYILRKFRVCFSVVELLLGDRAANNYTKFFYSCVSQENIPMRAGPWLPAECKRLEKGILTVLGVNSLKETVGRKIPWPKILPFVRTRPVMLYHPAYRRLLAQKEVIKKTVLPFSVEKQLIESIYESGVESFQDIDWEDIDRSIPNQSASNLKKHFRYLMLKVPVYCRRNFEDTLEYLFKFMNDRYKIRNGLTGRNMGVDSTTEEEDLPDSSNMSVMSDTTFNDDLESDYSFVNELFDDY